MFIGYYNKSIVLTFISLFITLVGIKFALDNEINYSLICLLISGVCDGFDGYVASKTKRTKNEKKYGIELDSLADVICFGLFPIIIAASLKYTSYINFIVYFIYCFCAVTRLAYFNIDTEQKDCFKGVPVTTASFIFPIILFFIHNEIVVMCLFLLIGLSFVTNFKIKKFTMKERIIYLAIIAIIISLMIWRILK